MKSWHALVLAASIVGGFGILATVLAVQNRYHYAPTNIDGRLGRIDRFTGAVEVYDRDRGWYDVRAR